MFPIRRLRRLRDNSILRGLVEEHYLRLEDFVYPLFVVEGEGIRREVSSMPGVYNLSIDELIKECRELISLGIRSIILFGVPDEKGEKGLVACRDDGIIQRSLLALREEFGSDILLITDLCFCEYTSHGHCGVLDGDRVDNDETLVLLGDQALSHARSGADIIAPSGMMDGMVSSIRSALDGGGFNLVSIMSYSVKYSSYFYGPFREAACSSPGFGDRRGYQMNSSNAREAFLEVDEDIREGADILMVKPALSYLDIIYRIKERYNLPLAAYNVSGEYSMIKAASSLGYVDERGIVMESLLSIKRAGADIIISYFAKDFAKWWRGE